MTEYGMLQPQSDSQHGHMFYLNVLPGSWKAARNDAAASPNPTTSAAQRLAALSSGLSPSPFLQTTSGPSPLLAPGTPLAASVDELGLPGIDVNTGIANPMSAQTRPTGLLPHQMPPSSAGFPLHAAGSFADWAAFRRHLSSLSASQRTEFMTQMAHADRYYAEIVRVQGERSGPHCVPLEQQDLEALYAAVNSTPQPDEYEAKIEALLEACELSGRVSTAVKEATAFFENHLKQQAAYMGEYSTSQIVSINGFPFLLHIPQAYSISKEKRLEAYIQLKKATQIRIICSLMLNLTRSRMSSEFDPQSIAARLVPPSPLRPGQQQAVGGGAPPPGGLGGIAVGQNAAQMARDTLPAARLAIVINIDQILALLVPLTFLAAKLGFLIYIFGRNASNRKLAVMIGMAVMYVFWEGLAIRRRRRAVEAARNRAALQQQQQQPLRQNQANTNLTPAQQEAQAQRRALRDQQRQAAHEELRAAHARLLPGAQGLPPDQMNPPVVLDNADDLYAPIVIRDPREREAAQREMRRAARAAYNERQRALGLPEIAWRGPSAHRPVANRLSPKYWMQCLARVGLGAEAREMGVSRSNALHPASSSSPPRQPVADADLPGPPGIEAIVSDPNDLPPLTPRRALRNMYVCLVLFFATLIPEVERLRRRALEKRTRKIIELVAARQASIAARQAISQGGATTSQENIVTSGAPQEDITQSLAETLQRRLQEADTNDASGNDSDASVPALALPRPASISAAGLSDAAAQPNSSEGPTTIQDRGEVSSSGAVALPDNDATASGELFDPPFDADALAAALAAHNDLPSLSVSAPPHRAGENGASHNLSASSSLGVNEPIAGPSYTDRDGRQRDGPADTLTEPSSNGQIHSALEVNATNLLAHRRQLQRERLRQRQQQQQDETLNGNAPGEDGLLSPLTPGTPLLSPAEVGSEDEDSILQPDDPNEAVDDEVGM